MARKTWVGILSDFVRNNPRTSAMIAFNLGVWAAQASRKSIGRADLMELPSKLIDLVPSMKDLESYLPALPSPAKRKTAQGRKPARRRTAKRRTAKHRAA
jgi:hypothetical protein